VDQWTLALPLKVSCCNVVAVHRTAAVAAFYYTAYMALHGIAVAAVRYTANVAVYVGDYVVSGVDCAAVAATAVAGIAAAVAASLQENPLRALIETFEI
jgi:hypothetical protein